MLKPELVATANFNEAKRRFTATKACQEGDGDVLIALMNAYLNSRGKKGSKTSAATRETYGTGLLRWLHFCWPDRELGPRVSILRATEGDVEAFRTSREDAGNAPSTVSVYLAAVRTLYNALVWAGAIERSPAVEVRSPTDPRPAWERNSAVPWEDYKRLLALCKAKGGAVGARNLALVRLLGDGGLRIAEACALDIGDIDLERKQVVVQVGKGGKKRTIAITTAGAEALAAWVTRRRPLVVSGERALLINVGRYCMDRVRGRRMNPKSAAKMLGRLYLEAGIAPHISGAHPLRHTSGTRVYKATGGDIAKVARHLGHSNVNTSSVYAKFTLDEMHDVMDLLDQSEEN